MRDATSAALQGGGHAPLGARPLTRRVPRVVDAVGFELQAQRVHQVVRQHADERKPLNVTVDAVERRAQTQVGLEQAEHRHRLVVHDVGAPQGGVVLIEQGGAQAVHARVRHRAAAHDALGSGADSHQLTRGFGGHAGCAVLRGAGEALSGAPQALHDGGHVMRPAWLDQAGLALGQRGLQGPGLGGVELGAPGANLNDCPVRAKPSA